MYAKISAGVVFSSPLRFVLAKNSCFFHGDSFIWCWRWRDENLLTGHSLFKVAGRKTALFCVFCCFWFLRDSLITLNIVKGAKDKLVGSPGENGGG
jgi:hypothetical protein